MHEKKQGGKLVTRAPIKKSLTDLCMVSYVCIYLLLCVMQIINELKKRVHAAKAFCAPNRIPLDPDPFAFPYALVKGIEAFSTTIPMKRAFSTQKLAK